MFNCAVLDGQPVEQREKVGGSGCHGPIGHCLLALGCAGMVPPEINPAPLPFEGMRAMTSIAFRPVHALSAEIAERRLSPVDLMDE